MKTRSMVAAVIGLVLVAGSGLWAQDKTVAVKDPAETRELNAEAYIRLLRSNLNTNKQAIIKEAMQLNDQQAAAFWPIYQQYNAEQNKLGDEKLGIVKDYAQTFLTMSDAQADQLAHRVMALDEQKLALRQKYYDLLKKALPTVLVVRFFQVENQIQLLVDLQIASNLPIIEQSQ